MIHTQTVYLIYHQNKLLQMRRDKKCNTKNILVIFTNFQLFQALKTWVIFIIYVYTTVKIDINQSKNSGKNWTIITSAMLRDLFRVYLNI